VKKLVSLLLLFLLFWQTAELAWRRFAWAQSPPEVPLWACLALLALNLAVLAYGAKRIFLAPRKIAS
jgi:hypothetical protein